ncbi:hypothetical protein LBMAG10_13810 [Actinomycetes bacterium]|nr:hypothetical protein LBMAG10_13810 [Actinomycetes bacterium]
MRDLRWLNLLDESAIAELVKNSGGKLLIVHEANNTDGFGAEISARIGETHFVTLKAPIMRLATPDSRIPGSPILQSALIPTISKIVEAATELHNA